MKNALLCIIFYLLSCTVTVLADDTLIREGDKTRPPSRNRRQHRVSPEGDPERVVDSDGIDRRKRRSRLNLDDLDLEDDEEDVDIQLMRDVPAVNFRRVKRVDFPDDPFSAWTGEDELGRTLTVVTTTTADGIKVTTGTMQGDNFTTYSFRTQGDRETIVEEMPQIYYDKEFEGGVVETGGYPDVEPDTIDKVDMPIQQRNLRRLDSPSQLDVMVLYTKSAMCSAVGVSNGLCSATSANQATMEGIINLAVSETNTAYAQSGVSTRLRLVKTHYDASYNDKTTSWETTLGYLRNNGDGQLDYVHAMRNQYGADFVSLLVDTGSYCGIGYRPDNPTAADAFSVVMWSCATGYYSFGHEMAHNMGCNHDRANAGGGSGGSNYGYQYSSGSSYDSRFRSIMSYDCPNTCPRVQYFSNPRKTYRGQPIGTSSDNNAAWIQARLSTYANFRPEVNGVTSGGGGGGGDNNSPTPAPTRAPQPTGPPTNEDSLTTTLSGGFVGGAGNMFDVRAKTDLSVTNFAMHSYAATTVTVEVWKKKTYGTCVGSQKDQSQWQKVGQATFQGSTAYQPSIMPTGSFPPVYIPEGQVQAFYVTFTPKTNYNRYSSGTTLGNVQASNADMDILEGYAKGYLFGDDYFPRQWNGIVYYERGSVRQAPRPTSPPTERPTPPPTERPTPRSTPGPVTTPRPTQRPTPSPTNGNQKQVDEQLTTTFAGGNGQAGNMFEIQVSQDVTVTAFDIHTYASVRVHAYVFYKKGSYIGFEHDRNAWTKVCDTWVQGAGSPNPTNVELDSPVIIPEGQSYSFYVTLTESKIRYTNGIIKADDGIIRFVNSSGNKYPFGTDYVNRIWNGVIHYSTHAQAAAPNPPPVPNSSYGPSRRIQTTFANKNGSYGSMFDIVAKEDLIVHNVWVHTYHKMGDLVDVEVYMLKAADTSFVGNEQDAQKWKKIGGAIVEGQGTGSATRLPPGSITPIHVDKGQRQALYVTIVGGGMRYSNGASGTNLLVYSENSDIQVYEGAGVGAARFGGTFTPRVFNGVLEYYTPNKQADIAADAGVSGVYDNGGSLFDEGWPCEAASECASGLCGPSSGDSQPDTLVAGSSTVIQEPGVRRELGDAMTFCLDKNGKHLEDGDTEEAGSST